MRRRKVIDRSEFRRLVVRILSKTRYALRILVHIARESRNGRLAQGKEIALKQNLNEPYLEQIMIPLRRSGLVRTVRGRNGGYGLGKEPGAVTLYDIIQIFEGDPEGTESNEKFIATKDKNPVDAVWSELAQVVNAVARDRTLESMLDSNILAEPEYVI